MTVRQAPERQVRGYRLSTQQSRLWRLAQEGRRSWAQVLVRIDGQLDADLLATALLEVVQGHEIMRTTFRSAPGLRSAVQIVGDDATRHLNWRTRDLRGLDGRRHRDGIAAEAAARRAAPDDPADGPVVHATLFILSARQHALLITASVLAADSAALRYLVDELTERYGGSRPGEVLQYSQFAEWQHELADERGAEAAQALVRGRSPAEPLRFPLSRPAPGHADPALTETFEAELPADTASALLAYARRRQVSAEAVLLAGWQALLWRITGQRDIAVGTCFAGRKYEETAGCLGPFAAWLGTRSRFERDTAFDAVALGVERQLAEGDEVEEFLPGLEAVHWDAAFEYKETVAARTARGATFTVAWDDVDAEPYSVKLECVVGPAAVSTIWHCRPDRFAARYPRHLAAQYRTLLAGLIDGPETPVRAVSLLDREARLELIAGSSRTGRGEQTGDCLHQLIQRQAERTPEAEAVVDRRERLTYRELERRANQLAKTLIGRGVGVETPVAVCAGHSARLVVALLAVLKSGGAYVPLDPKTPVRRIERLLARTGCGLLLTDAATAAGLAGLAVDRIDIDGPPAASADSAAHGTDSPTPPPPVSPDNLAYIMFTSGSTGDPKGVMLPHRALANYARWSAGAYLHGAGSGSIAHSSIAFDLTVTSLFVPLLAGRPVRIDAAWRDPLALAAELAGPAPLDLLKLTPSHLKVLNHTLGPRGLAGAAHSLVVGGEALRRELIRPWLRHTPPARVFNEYGPTESAVGCCVHEADESDGGEAVPIGRPIAGADVYVLDDAHEPAAVGVPGEICVGGEGLARGYLGEPGASADRFVPHPFSPEPGRRLYRTGDLGCYGPGGELHFLGRSDEQFKIRGVRVEPEEIRAALCAHPSVRDAVAVPLGERVAAYLVATDAGPAPEAQVRAFVAELLPAQLVPDSYTWLDEIPLTGNGKVDRAALPAPGTRAAGRRAQPPRDAAELAVVRIFEELLAAGTVGADEDFFALGGHSLLAVQLIARLNTAFDRDLPLSVLFGGPATARRLADLLHGRGPAYHPGPVIALREAGAGAPLFCVHPAGGDVVGFRDLSLSTALRRPVYGLQAPPLEHGDAEQGIDFLADRYVAAIDEVRPHGPCVLLGWSVGGAVAFEMAGRLDSGGSRVALLALVDTYLADQLERYDESAILRQFADQLSQIAGAEIAMADDEMRTLSPAAGPERILAAAAERGFTPSARERDELILRHRLNRAHLRAVQRYRPEPCAVPVTVVQAAETDPRMRQAAATMWTDLCPRLNGVHTLPGSHLSLLREPHVATLVELLERHAPPS